MSNLPLDPAELHDAMRQQGIAPHDEPWHLCPAEYRFRLERVVTTINDEHDVHDSINSQSSLGELYEEGYADGHAQGTPYNKTRGH